VGRTTGQSSARVDQNCVDIQSSSNPGLWTLCSQMAKLGVRGGDSGGTVFVPKVTGNSSTPRAAGVIFAGNLSGTESYFSPIGYVHSSLGYRFIFY
jgi:hypothetical protein